MLCADTLAFQFPDYARNFAVSCRRLLHADYNNESPLSFRVTYAGRRVQVRVAHVQINYHELHSQFESPDFQPLMAQVSEAYQRFYVFLGSDRGS